MSVSPLAALTGALAIGTERVARVGPAGRGGGRRDNAASADHLTGNPPRSRQLPHLATRFPPLALPRSSTGNDKLADRSPRFSFARASATVVLAPAMLPLVGSDERFHEVAVKQDCGLGLVAREEVAVEIEGHGG